MPSSDLIIFGREKCRGPEHQAGVPDPAAVVGPHEQVEKAFRDAFFLLDRRISLFLCLPLASIDRLALKKELDNIGRQ